MDGRQDASWRGGTGAIGESGQALSAHLLDITNRIIRGEGYATTEDAEEILEPALLR